MSKINPVPAGHSALVVSLATRDCTKAIAFYKAAFAATEDYRLVEANGKIGHAELRINGALLMLSDEYPDFGCLSPASIGGCPMKLLIYVPDVDAAIARAIAAGATLVRTIRNEFYGDRTGTVADPFGYSWQLSSRIEAVTPAEMQTRWDKVMAGGV